MRMKDKSMEEVIEEDHEGKRNREQMKRMERGRMGMVRRGRGGGDVE